MRTPPGSERARRVLAELDDPEVKYAIEHELRLRTREDDYKRRRKVLEAAAAAAAPGSPAAAQAQKVVKIVEEVHRQGFSIVHEFLHGERLARVRDGMQVLFDSIMCHDPQQLVDVVVKPSAQNALAVDTTRPQALNVDNVFAKTRAVDEVGMDPLLRAVISGIIGPNFWLSCAHAKCPFPGCAPQGLHRDDGRFAFPAPHPHRPMVANTLIALDDFTRENGGTMFIPGSHIWDRRRRPESSDEVQYLEMPAGSIFFFDGALWHAGGGNSSRDKYRRTICLNYTPDWLRTIENHTLGIPKEMAFEMPRQLQRDLGFFWSKTMLGNVEMMQPIDFLKRQSKL
eukprot:gnl/TRDRNA2_/TRDRNA2_188820_c0_seq1.p1 gnl/TRDRNA2_/TRDRNA2_188820_c0~~gnl/TRDRNA2_/TRDRNA2_188820_c0_seq1.p1  ORF type:complete len:341 (+),score=62.42 gnl/TRDRNA2_/TRDRNA2_188820_c0_seq1:59-1081(+)